MTKQIAYRPGLRLPVLGTPIFVFGYVLLKDWPLLASLSLGIAVGLFLLIVWRFVMPGTIQVGPDAITIPTILFRFKLTSIPFKSIFYWEQMGSAEAYLAIHFETEAGQAIHSLFRSSLKQDEYQWLLDKLNEIVKNNGHVAPKQPAQEDQI